MELTQQIVRNLFEYKDGILYNKTYRSSNAQKGDQAGTLRKDGYYNININYKSYLIHRIIFLYHHGYLPNEIDHIDRNPSNNKIENLRKSNQSQNMMNQKQQKNTSSIYKGVFWKKLNNKWQAQIQINGKRKYLGLFTNELDAAIAYNKAAIELFGKFAYLNEVEQINILICDGCGEQIFDCAHHIQYENDLVFHNSDCEDSYNRC